MTMLLGIQFKESNRQASPICSFNIPTKKTQYIPLVQEETHFPKHPGWGTVTLPLIIMVQWKMDVSPIWGSFHLGWFSTSMLVGDRVVPGCSFWCSTMPPAIPKGSSQGGLPTQTNRWHFTDLSGPARFGQAKTFQSPEARNMRRRLRKGALKGKAEAEAGCPSVMEISSDGCPKWT